MLDAFCTSPLGCWAAHRLESSSFQRASSIQLLGAWVPASLADLLALKWRKSRREEKRKKTPAKPQTPLTTGLEVGCPRASEQMCKAQSLLEALYHHLPGLSASSTAAFQASATVLLPQVLMLMWVTPQHCAPKKYPSGLAQAGLNTAFQTNLPIFSALA